jgi:hypothetical protein
MVAIAFDGGQLAESVLTSAVVVTRFDPVHDRETQLVAGGPAALVEDVLSVATKRRTPWRRCRRMRRRDPSIRAGGGGSVRADIFVNEIGRHNPSEQSPRWG